MIALVANNLLRALILILAQVLVLDHLDVANGWVVPYLYVLFLLMLPFSVPAWAQLFIGFGMGMAIDLFSSTPGMHTSACLVMMFARPWVLRTLAPRDGYDHGRQPTLQHMGTAWTLSTYGALVLLHHLWLFFAEVHRFDAFFSTIARALLSTLATLLLCALVQSLFARNLRRA